MKKIFVYLPVLILLMAAPGIDRGAQAFGNSAMDYFNQGLNSSMAYKKIEYFSKALELNPRLASAYEKRGMHYFFQEKYDKVIEDLTRYIRLVPDKADAYLMLGAAYLKIKNYDKAIVNFDQALNINPKMSAAFGNRAEAFRLKGDSEKAIVDASNAIRIGGDARTLAEAYKTRGKAFYELGQDDLSNRDINKSIELDPRLVLIKYLSAYASPEQLRSAGLVGMIGIAFVFIFGFRLKTPVKNDKKRDGDVS